jgi:hypothetical protein
MIYLQVATELADELVEAGVAKPQQKPRGTIIDLVVVGAATAATCVSLLQGPETVMKIARALVNLAKKKSQAVELRVKGPRGEIHLLSCDADTPLEEIAKLIKSGLLG